MPEPGMMATQLTRLVIGLLVVSWPLAAAAQGGKGSISGTMSAPVEASRDKRVDVGVRDMGWGGMATTDDKGRYKIRGVPAGMREVCVRGWGFRTVFDTVEVVKGHNLVRNYVLEPVKSGRQPHPSCDHSLPTLFIEPVDSATHPITETESLEMWYAAFRYHRASGASTEGDLINETNRVLGRPVDSSTTGLVVKPSRRTAASPVVLEWLATLTGQGVVATCTETDAEQCPRTG